MHPYGGEHKRARRAALAVFEDGLPCPLCRKPMHYWQALDLDHVVPLRAGGSPDGPKRLTHARCNRSTGAALGNRLRGKHGRKRARRLPRW